MLEQVAELEQTPERVLEWVLEWVLAVAVAVVAVAVVVVVAHRQQKGCQGYSMAQEVVQQVVARMNFCLEITQIKKG